MADAVGSVAAGEAQRKTCIKCGETKPLDEFPDRKDSKDGKRGDCRGCARIKSREKYHRKVDRLSADPTALQTFRETAAKKAQERYWKDPQTKRAYRREYGRKNPEKEAAARKLYRENNRERVSESRRKWGLENAEAQKRYKAEEYRRNRAYYIEKQRRFRISNPEKIKTYRDKHLADPKNRISATVRSGICHSLKSASEKKNRRTWESLVGYTSAELMAHLEKQFLKGMSWTNFGEWQIDHILPISSFTFDSPLDPEFKACWSLSNLRPLWAPDNKSKNDKILFLI